MRKAGMLLLLLSVLLVTGLAVAAGHGPANSEIGGFAVVPIEDWFTADDAVELTEETKIELEEEVTDVSLFDEAVARVDETMCVCGETWAAPALRSRPWLEPKNDFCPLL